MKKKIAAIAIFALMLMVFCSGCFLQTSAEELYSLPQGTEGFKQLQRQINAVLESGAEYSAPTSGSNRQAVQFRDLNGDGTDEAIAFFTGNGEKPLNIYVFTKAGNDYETAFVLEGDGTAIDSVSYPDMDGDGNAEIVVGWQISTSVKMLNIYATRDNQTSLIISTDYDRYSVADFGGDGTSVLVFHPVVSDNALEVTNMSLMPDGEIIEASARLSEGIETIAAVSIGMLDDETPAAFIDSVFDGGLITDILVASGTDELSNITINSRTHTSGKTQRGAGNYCTDINGDGTIEVPTPEEVLSQSETAYRIIRWRNYMTNGRSKYVLTTYSNNSDGWYIVLPEQWADEISVRREDRVAGERTIVFSTVRDDNFTDVLAIYALSGDNKEDRSRLDGRFVLKNTGEKVFAAKLFVADVDESTVKNSFHLIYAEWNT